MATETAPAAVAPDRPAASPQRPGVAVRLFAWAVVPVYVAGITCYLLLAARLGDAGLDAAEGVPLVVGFFVFAAMGALLVARRPRNPVGWLMTGSALLLAVAPAGDTYAAWVMTTRGSPDALAVVGGWLQSWYWFVLLGVVFVYLPLLFPDGRLPSRRWRPVAVLAALALATASALGMLQETYSGQDVDYRIDNPIGIDGLAPVEELPVFAVLGIALAVCVVAAVAAVVVRFRSSRGPERQQMKWFVFAVAPAVFAPLDSVVPLLSSVVFFWLLIALPIAVAVAVLRYRLDGIDVVINRTLVYGVLTALVIGVYVLVVGYLGAALRREDDLAVSLVATGIVAVLFAPARARVQRAVDRLLYGRRNEPYAALAQLGERLEGTLAPDAVLPAIVSAVRETLRLPYVAVRLADDAPPGGRRGARARDRDAATDASRRAGRLAGAGPATGRVRLLPRRPPAADRSRPAGRCGRLGGPAHRRPAAIAGAAGDRAGGGAPPAAARPARRARRPVGRADRADRRPAHAHRPRPGGGRGTRR